ncbi:3760_t:CDS:2, partial [Scutellospora calospora]
LKEEEELKIVEEELPRNSQDLKLETSLADSKIVELEKKVEELIQELENVQKKSNDTHLELEKRVEELLKEKTDLISDKENLTRDFETAQKKSNDTHAELEKKIEELLKERNDLISGKESLIKDLEIVQKKSNEIHTELDDEKEAVREMKEKLSETEKNYKVFESDNALLHAAKTQALEKLSDVESRLKSVTQREHDLQESLNEAKATIQKHESEMEGLRKQILEEEDKRNKTVTLLKKLQLRIHTLEKEKKDISEEMERLQELHKVSEQNATANLKQESARFNKELSAKSAQIEKLTTEKEGLFDQLQIKQAEFDSSQSLLETLQHGSKEMTRQLKETEERSQALEEETTSLKKRLKEIKRENETLKTKVEDLTGVTEKLEVIKKQIEDYKQGKEKAELELIEIKRTSDVQKQDMIGQLTAREQEKSKLMTAFQEKEELLKLAQDENDSLKKLVQELDEKMNALTAKMANADEKSVKYRELEHNLQRSKEEYEKLLEEARMREGQLRNNNRSLKEEVRKLQKSSDRGTPTSPLQPSSPTAIRNSIPSNPPTILSTGLDDDVKVDYLRALLPVLTTLLRIPLEEKKRLELKYETSFTHDKDTKIFWDRIELTSDGKK